MLQTSTAVASRLRNRPEGDNHPPPGGSPALRTPGPVRKRCHRVSLKRQLNFRRFCGNVEPHRLDVTRIAHPEQPQTEGECRSRAASLGCSLSRASAESKSRSPTVHPEPTRTGSRQSLTSVAEVRNSGSEHRECEGQEVGASVRSRGRVREGTTPSIPDAARPRDSRNASDVGGGR